MGRLGGNFLVLAHQPEQGFRVQGYTTKKDKEEERIRADVMLSSLSDEFYANKTTTDPSGNFSFINLPQLDSTDFIIQGQVYNSKRSNAGTQDDRQTPSGFPFC